MTYDEISLFKKIAVKKAKSEYFIDLRGELTLLQWLHARV